MEIAVKISQIRKKYGAFSDLHRTVSNFAKSLISREFVPWRLIITGARQTLDKRRLHFPQIACAPIRRHLCVNQRMATVARPRNEKKPPTSVKVVTKMDEAMAGS